MILLLTNRRDITSDYIVLELKRRGIPFHRLNTDTLSESLVDFDPTKSGSWSIRRENELLELSKVQAGYFRRPLPPSPPAEIIDPGERKYCVDEWSAVLKSLYWSMGERWLNSPKAILFAEDKPMQLELAQSYEWLVPKSVVTNDVERAMAFTDQVGAVAKPLRQAVLEGQNDRVIFTSRVTKLTAGDRQALKVSPFILQQEVEKAADIRVTVVGSRTFSTAIHSQVDEEAKVDWRRGSNPGLHHEPIVLPANIEQSCIEMTRKLGLRYSAIDLVLDPNGDHWFLEINPNGQWAWIENRTGHPIASAIVDELEQIASQ